MKDATIPKKKCGKEANWIVRNKLVMDHLPLVRYVVGKILVYIPPQMDHGDLVESGIIGLIDAAEKYDNRRETKFGTYAVSRIRGSILDYLRSQDWVPRSIREKAAVVKGVWTSLEQKLNRPPRAEEMADALNMDVCEWDKLLTEVSSNSFTSIEEFKDKIDGYDETYGGDSVRDRKVREPLFNLEEQEERELLEKAIYELPRKERLVITLYYYECLLSKEISKILGISESRVSQLHRRALLLLRARMSKTLAFATT